MIKKKIVMQFMTNCICMFKVFVNTSAIDPQWSSASCDPAPKQSKWLKVKPFLTTTCFCIEFVPALTFFCLILALMIKGRA